MRDKSVIIVAAGSMKKPSKSILLFAKKYSLREEKNSMLRNKEH